MLLFYFIYIFDFSSKDSFSPEDDFSSKKKTIKLTRMKKGKFF